jgi:hypothetical protein
LQCGRLETLTNTAWIDHLYHQKAPFVTGLCLSEKFGDTEDLSLRPSSRLTENIQSTYRPDGQTPSVRRDLKDTTFFGIERLLVAVAIGGDDFRSGLSASDSNPAKAKWEAYQAVYSICGRGENLSFAIGPKWNHS